LRPADPPAAAHVESVLNSLRRTIRAFRAAAMTAESVLGISGAQHFALEKLAGAPALSLNELATRTLTHKSSAPVVVSRLVLRGYVRRQRSAADRRSIVLTLTPAGRRALERAPDSASHGSCAPSIACRPTSSRGSRVSSNGSRRSWVSRIWSRP